MGGRRTGVRRMSIRGLLPAAILAITLTAGGEPGALAQRAIDPPPKAAPGAGVTGKAIEKKPSSEEIARRAATRLRFAGQSAGDALATARRLHARVLDRPVGRLLRLRRGVEFEKWLGDRSVLVDAGDHDAVVASTLPLRTRDQAGKSAWTDLTLVDRGDHLASRTPHVPVKIAKEIAAGVAFPAGFSIVALKGASTTPLVHEGKVFWPEVLTDTDAMVVPVAQGIETFAQLRSINAPEELRMPVSLPTEAVLRGRSDGGAEIVRAAQVLASVSFPRAADAEQRPVAVEMEVEGEELVLRVDHVGQDVAYPVLVDPTVSNYASHPGWTAGPNYGSFRAWRDSTHLGIRSGLDVGYAEWLLTVPRQSYIEFAQFHSFWTYDMCSVLGTKNPSSGAQQSYSGGWWHSTLPPPAPW